MFKDEYSNYRLIYFVKTKDQVFDCIVMSVAQIFADTQKQVVTELVSKRTQDFLLEKSIIQETSAPFTPEQNGFIERDNRTVMEGARSILFDKKLPQKLWGEAANTVVYLLNRSVNKNTGAKTPYELYFGKKPKVNYLRVFGSLAYMKLQEKKR